MFASGGAGTSKALPDNRSGCRQRGRPTSNPVLLMFPWQTNPNNAQLFQLHCSRHPWLLWFVQTGGVADDGGCSRGLVIMAARVHSAGCDRRGCQSTLTTTIASLMMIIVMVSIYTVFWLHLQTTLAK